MQLLLIKLSAKIKLRQLSVCLAAALLVSLLVNRMDFAHAKTPNQGGSTDAKKSSTFSVMACVTWWSHDAVGYHPAMFLMLENNSGHEIAGEEIPFQARFTDLREGYITVAREYKRTPVRAHERFALFLRGPRSFELPIDSSLWPAMECKAMCRLNASKGDSNLPVEDLFVTHLSRLTMSDEDAQSQLIAQAGRSLQPLQQERLQIQSATDNNAAQDETDDKPVELRAMPSTIGSGAESKADKTKAAKTKASKTKTSKAEKPKVKTPKTKTEQTPLAKTKKSKIKLSTILSKHLPGIGDDFYVFEQFYGPALEFQAGSGSADLTWTHYPSYSAIADVYAGSRNASKVDLIIVTLPIDANPKEADLLSLIRLLTHSNKQQPITPFAHSVRYLSNGRSEIMTTAVKDYRVLSFKIRDTNGQPSRMVLAISRLPGDLESAITNYSQQVKFLNVLQACM